MATLALAPHRHLRPRYRYWLVIVLLTMTVAPAFAQAFRWVGQDGSLHLSDRPPPTKAQPWYPVEIPRYNQPSLPPKQNPYSVINQLKRMEERRVAVREKRWQERLEDLEQQRQRRELANDEV